MQLISNLPDWQTKAFITITKRDGYPFGLEMESKDGTREIHGTFATPADAHAYRARLFTAYSGYKSGKIVKIETPAMPATDALAFDFPSMLINQDRVPSPRVENTAIGSDNAELMIMALDYTGLPRAFAYGPASKRNEIAERVREELGAYCARQKALGEVDLADPARYTIKLEVLAQCPHCDDKRKLQGHAWLSTTCLRSECQEASYRANGGKRYVGELVELTRDCEIGMKGEHARVMVISDDVYMTLDFFNRSDKPGKPREMRTGADYRFIRGVK